MRPTSTIRLKPGKEKPVLNHHPWVFSGAVAGKRGDPADGDIVDVVDGRGRLLARGYYNRQSQIVVRLLNWDHATEVDAAFFCQRIQQAAARRASILAAPDTNACRLVHAESDLLTGLVVDRYANYLVTQFLTAGMERWKAEIVSCLAGLSGVHGIYDRSDVDVREKEGLASSVGTLYGETPPDVVEIREHDRRPAFTSTNGRSMPPWPNTVWANACLMRFATRGRLRCTRRVPVQLKCSGSTVRRRPSRPPSATPGAMACRPRLPWPTSLTGSTTRLARPRRSGM